MRYNHCCKPLLLFDFGIILTGLDKHRCIRALEKIGCGRIAYYVDECRQEDLFHELEVGGSIEAFCEEARRQSAYTDENGNVVPCKATDEDICWAWNELLTGVPVEKLRLVKHLHDDLGYRTAILSNTNYIHWEKSVRDIFTIDGLTVEDYFDDIFLSCGLGMVKPDDCIYQEVIKRLGVKAEEIVFFDDSEKNCIAARRNGINAIHDPKGTRWMTEVMAMEKGRAAVIGNFDGLHKGHQYVIDTLKREAKDRDLMPIAISFDRHPRALFDASFVPSYLSPKEEKCDILMEAVGDTRIMIFDKEFAALSAKDFMEKVLRDELNVKLLLLGYDNRFGKRNDNEGIEQYKEYGRELGIEVLLAEPYDVEGTRVSSSYIRKMITEGNMEEAEKCLGRAYCVSGTVVKGHQEGRKIGFPTANIEPENEKLLPANGVYATRVKIEGDEALYRGMTNIGKRPTYNGHHVTVETNIIDFIGDIYGKRVSVEFIKKIRDERQFSSPEELKKQIEIDKEKV